MEKTTPSQTWFLAAIALIAGGLVAGIGGDFATAFGWLLVSLGVVLAIRAFVHTAGSDDVARWRRDHRRR